MKMNTQLITKRIIPTTENFRIAVHSIFATIQGEGPHAGKPAIFIRLWGCNLQCPMCDTDYTSSVNMYTPEELAMKVAEMRTVEKLIVITGGEPLRQPLTELIMALLLHVVATIQIETNGTLPAPEDTSIFSFCDVVCSPKTGTVHSSLYPFITAYKYVLHEKHVAAFDGLPTKVLDHSTHVRVARPHKGFKGPVYLQPADTQDDAENAGHLQATVDSCLAHGYTLCIQVHKLIGVP